MSLLTCLKYGTGGGFVVGMFLSSYGFGAAELAAKKDHPGTLGIKLISAVTLTISPFLGAGAGISYFITNKTFKYLKRCPRSTQLALLALTTSSLAIAGAYKLGKKE